MVFRKINNKILDNYIKLIQEKLNKQNYKLKKHSESLELTLVELKNFANWPIKKNDTNKDDVSAACNEFLKVLGYISLGFFLA